MMYIPANNNLCQTMAGVPVTYVEARPRLSPARSKRAGDDSCVQAPTTSAKCRRGTSTPAQKVWTHNYRMANWGPLLATGGGLVFGGGTPDQKFHAFDAATGKLLWEFETSSGVEGPPSSFEVDGKQYIAVMTGWGADASGAGGTVARFFPESQSEDDGGGRSGLRLRGGVDEGLRPITRGREGIEVKSQICYVARGRVSDRSGLEA